MILKFNSCMRRASRRFDGRTYAAVGTAEIYSQPSYPARDGKADNPRFFCAVNPEIDAHTSQYVAMRALQLPDGIPSADLMPPGGPHE